MSTPLPDPARPVVASGPADDAVSAFVLSGLISAVTGAVAGLLWGGIGGRIAMRVVFLTSSERVRGVTSDDGFEIGTISLATIFLLAFAGVLGAIAGGVVGLLRMVTAGPTWAVAVGVATATATFGGAVLVHSDGIDFRLLDPLWLTVGLFVLIPGVWGASVILATDRLFRSRRLVGVTQLVHRRYAGAVGWFVLAGATAVGVRDLVADIGRLT